MTLPQNKLIYDHNSKNFSPLSHFCVEPPEEIPHQSSDWSPTVVNCRLTTLSLANTSSVNKPEGNTADLASFWICTSPSILETLVEGCCQGVGIPTISLSELVAIVYILSFKSDIHMLYKLTRKTFIGPPAPSLLPTSINTHN